MQNNKKYSKNESISVIVGIRDRYDYRIINALKSIRTQDYNQNLIEIILVDYGSKEKYLRIFDKLCKKFKVKGIWTKIKSNWNRAHAINIGIKTAKTKYILASDVDIIFNTDYISKCIKELQINVNQALYCRMFDSKKGQIKKSIKISKKTLEKLKKKCIPRNLGGNFPYGISIILAQKKFFEKIRGYDEFYEIWGSEDIDLAKRLEKTGIRLHNISNKTFHIHQWHLKHENVIHLNEFEKQKVKNKKYCLYNLTIIRNPFEWGEIKDLGGRKNLLSHIILNFLIRNNPLKTSFSYLKKIMKKARKNE